MFGAWLQKHRAQIAGPTRELDLKVRARALAVDRGQSFVGVPSFTVPLVGFATQEIAVFRDVRHIGYAEIKISTTRAEPASSLP